MPWNPKGLVPVWADATRTHDVCGARRFPALKTTGKLFPSPWGGRFMAREPIPWLGQLEGIQIFLYTQSASAESLTRRRREETKRDELLCGEAKWKHTSKHETES